MNRYEKEDIQQLPSEYRPLGAWGYFGYNILFSLPIIGFIILLICAFSNSNINRRSYARSFFCWFIIEVILIAVVVILCWSYIEQIIVAISSLLEQIVY